MASPRTAQDEKGQLSKPVPVSSLNLDARNPRLVQLVGPNASQAKLLEILWREMAVDEIALSIASNGFFPHEPLFVTDEGSKLVVIEGNRRLAAVKILLDKELRQRLQATDLPTISPQIRQSLKTLPVVQSTREELWRYVGFKHVNGPQTWESYSKAFYIAWVHNELRVPLDDIARQIGDQNATVKRLYRGLMVLDQATAAGVFSLDDRAKSHFSFSHLYTGLDYPGIQKYLDIDPDRSYVRRPVPANRIPRLGELCLWLFGSKSRGISAIVQSQNPDLRRLDDVLLSKEGVIALKRGLPLAASHQISKGDAALFVEGLQAAKSGLQQARGTVLTGYDGDSSQVTMAAEVADLASALLKEMRETNEPRQRSASLKVRRRAKSSR